MHSQQAGSSVPVPGMGYTNDDNSGNPDTVRPADVHSLAEMMQSWKPVDGKPTSSSAHAPAAPAMAAAAGHPPAPITGPAAIPGPAAAAAAAPASGPSPHVAPAAPSGRQSAATAAAGDAMAPTSAPMPVPVGTGAPAGVPADAPRGSVQHVQRTAQPTRSQTLQPRRRVRAAFQVCVHAVQLSWCFVTRCRAEKLTDCADASSGYLANVRLFSGTSQQCTNSKLAPAHVEAVGATLARVEDGQHDTDPSSRLVFFAGRATCKCQSSCNTNSPDAENARTGHEALQEEKAAGYTWQSVCKTSQPMFNH